MGKRRERRVEQMNLVAGDMPSDCGQIALQIATFVATCPDMRHWKSNGDYVAGNDHQLPC